MKSKILSGITAVLFTWHTGSAQDIEEWTYIEQMPVAYGEMTGDTLGDKIYIGGGFGGTTGASEHMFTYTPATDEWSAIDNMPFGLHHANMGSLNGKFYVFGGCDHSDQRDVAPWLGSTHSAMYDPETEMWTLLDNPIPHSTAAGVVAAFDNKLYIIGGTDTNGVVLDLVQIFDPATGEWSEGSPMPTFREHFGVAVLDSLIYCSAGRQEGRGGVSHTPFEAYSPASDTWYTLPDVPTARSGVASTAANGRIYVMGGEWPGSFDLVEVYDPFTGEWEDAPPMQHRRHGFLAVTYDSTIYALGMGGPAEAFIPRPNENVTGIKQNYGINLGAVPGFSVLPFVTIDGYDVIGRKRSLELKINN